jgi:membrane protein implicated in regulation of membrane protease activity
MDEWVWWMIAAGVLAVGELATVGFFLGPVAVAAVLAAVVALVGGGLALQWIVFIAASIASLLVLRPLARRHLRTPSQLRSGTAALVGAQALVVERVDVNGGQVKIGGEIWSARAFDEDEVIEPGIRATVMKIDGATALVAE